MLLEDLPHQSPQRAEPDSPRADKLVVVREAAP
jgi:hypothetical protein